MSWNIEIDNGYFVVDSPWIESVARRTLERESQGLGGDLSIRLTTESDMQALNRAYRGLDEPTDVLSFGLESEMAQEFVLPPGATRTLGEIVIAHPYVERCARDAGLPIESELAHVLVHGVLHLLGFDHEKPDDEVTMRAREEAILRDLGIAHHHD